MAHYRVIPYLPQLPGDVDSDERSVTALDTQEPALDTPSVSWLIPLLIMAIAAFCLGLVFIG
ncbi:MAG: hypothetical protein HY253_01590 [Burkholderiales bacterium]|nr:hypothetical protein [Burkholderiales bacterium]